MTPATARALADARARTLAVLAPLTDEQLRAQHSPLMSPLVWDLAHIAHYEELWLLRELGAGEATDPRLDDIYDAFRHPRGERPDLDLLGPEAARALGDAVRARVLATTAPAAGERTDALLHNEFVHGLVVRHEHQHIETMLATMQLMSSGVPGAAGTGPGRRGAAGLVGAEVLVAAGPFVMGTDDDPWAYDNERPAHAVDLPAFLLDAAPTTNGEYREFVDAGGYDDPAVWTDAGWKWRQSEELAHPQFWSRHGDDWVRRRFGVVEPLPPLEPVQHVCWYEADAYARWAGKRLPTEAEWEKAASWDPGAGTGVKARHPWGPEPPDRADRGARRVHGPVGPRRDRCAPGRRDAERHRRPPRRRVGMDGLRLRRVPRLPELPLPGILRGVLRPRVQGAPGRFVGDPPARGEHHVPQLGLPHPPTDLRRLPLRAGPLMCRHLAYLGPPRPVRALTVDAPHSLCSQGRAPREMVVAKDNPDGWGVAWWEPGTGTPRRYRTTTKMWEDHGFADGEQPAVALLGAVRKASPHTTLRDVNNAPFLADTRIGPVAFSLNGHAFHASCEGRIRAALRPDTSLTGDTDSEVLFTLVRERIDAGADAAAAVAAVHHVIGPGPDVYVNLLLVTADRIVATTWHHTLYADHGNGWTTISSEPMDAVASWRRVPDASLVDATAGALTTTPLEALR